MNEKFILTVMNKFDSGSIAELDLSDGTYSLTLRKGRAGAPESGDTPAVRETQADAPVHLGISAAGNSAEAEDSGDRITSPIVATFYAAPGPDAPPFVKAGSKIKAGQTLCILEAMKMMNHLEAEFNCEITKVHAASGDLVEYGQTLFSVKRL